MELARTLFRRGSQRDPSDLYIWQAWGCLEFRAGEFAAARELFQQGIWASAPRDPATALVFQAWAVLERSAGNVDLARQLFKAAVKADPKSQVTWMVRRADRSAAPRCARSRVSGDFASRTRTHTLSLAIRSCSRGLPWRRSWACLTVPTSCAASRCTSQQRSLRPWDSPPSPARPAPACWRPSLRRCARPHAACGQRSAQPRGGLAADAAACVRAQVARWLRRYDEEAVPTRSASDLPYLSSDLDDPEMLLSDSEAPAKRASKRA